MFTRPADLAGSTGATTSGDLRLMRIMKYGILFTVLVASYFGLVTEAYSDWPTPLISVRCMPAMNLLTLNLIAEWNLCTHGQDCKALEDQGSYTDERFVQRFEKVPFLCQMANGTRIDIVPHITGKDRIGSSQYVIDVVSGGKSLYSFGSEGYYSSDETYGLNLFVDANIKITLMACRMLGQSLIHLPDAATCRASGPLFRNGKEVALSKGEGVLPH